MARQIRPAVYLTDCVKMMEDLGKSVIEEDDHMEHDGGDATVPKKAKV